jgi:LysM repeat protein
MAAPALSKQRDLCLVPAHGSCATYRAARVLELASPGALGPGAQGGFWPETRSTVLALEPARGRITAIPGTPGRAGGQALLVGLMVLAFIVLVIARTTPPSSGGATPSVAGGLVGSPSPAAASTGLGASSSAGPSASVDVGGSPSTEPATSSPVASGSAVPSPSGRATPSPKPTSTPVPANATRYKIKSGDTLSSIAARYNTTVKKLKAANGLTTNIIHVGQVLVIP